MTPDQQKWVVKLIGYYYEIVYGLGAQSKFVDALSHRDHNTQFASYHSANLGNLATDRRCTGNGPTQLRLDIGQHG